MTPIFLHSSAVSKILVGGTSQVVFYGPLQGGFIQNPAAATDQGLSKSEPIYVNTIGPASVSAGPTTVEVLPGGSLTIGPQTSSVWVNAASTGHAFSAVVIQPAPAPPVPGASVSFPPTSQTSVTTTLPSYLYQQYNGDDDLQAFIMAYNSLAQGMGPDWFNGTPLPVYTSGQISGLLLDWVATGLYGFPRPSLPVQAPTIRGPLNTYQTNQLPFNAHDTVGGGTFVPTSDDIYRRMLTWLFFKGDGRYFTVSWLKRRIARFLTGVDGADPPIDQTYGVSVTFGSNNTVNIATTQYSLELEEAIKSGVLELPFQFTYNITTGTL